MKTINKLYNQFSNRKERMLFVAVYARFKHVNIVLHFHSLKYLFEKTEAL